MLIKSFRLSAGDVLFIWCTVWKDTEYTFINDHYFKVYSGCNTTFL